MFCSFSLAEDTARLEDRHAMSALSKLLANQETCGLDND
jgi:hypothetical protein